MNNGVAIILTIVAFWIFWEVIGFVRLFLVSHEKKENKQQLELIRKTYSEMENDERILELMKVVYFTSKNITRLSKQAQGLKLLFSILFLFMVIDLLLSVSLFE